ncbi:glycosyltransferase family 4 protein [Lachnospira pectinoschiza]|uniref:Glycosyltransferase involved in cell wall bisynthesis n=1 Tax=Lachnospira pectinoschiza TaxID=28052 RepID=A0A1G9SSL2_9FIRM|nr:glycosyltransferase family 4 protein [Lachnospira pectinoschiza]SDM37845.1 Glycosyltransferase involved in cell wall bisynthesis [Lachnospira pectinoschiza]
MSLESIILKLGEGLRPVITKVVPMKLLSRMKASVVNKASANVAAEGFLPYEPKSFPYGVNLVGNIKGDNGLGQSARIAAKLLKTGDVPYVIRDFFVPPGGSRTNTEYASEVINEDGKNGGKVSQDQMPYGINLIDVNASEFTLAYMNMGKEMWDRHYNIGFWAWEVEDFPEEWLPAFNLVDEVWTPSEFVSNVLRKYTDKPVMTVPHCIELKTDSNCDRKYFGLPEDKFLFMVSFSSGSVMERKNPLAAIKAFKEAFLLNSKESLENVSSDGVGNIIDSQIREAIKEGTVLGGKKSGYNGVGLVIKISEPELSEKDADILASILTPEEQENVYIIKGTSGKEEMNSLVECVDAYVSLHRAEGFGLVMGEAMYLGTPCIATNWSGNVEFMNPSVACMVDAKLIELDRDLDPFKKGYKWADANVSTAAAYMKKLVYDKDYYDRIKKGAYEYARTHLAYENVAKKVKGRLDEISKE